MLSTTTPTLLAKAALPASPSPIGPAPNLNKRNSPQTRKTPAPAVAQQPVAQQPVAQQPVGPQSTNPQPEYVHIFSPEVIDVAGHADTIYGQATWVALVTCPAGTPHTSANQLGSNSACRKTEMLTENHGGGNSSPSHFIWGTGYEFGGGNGHTLGPNDFSQGIGYYDIWAWAQNSSGYNSTAPVPVLTSYYSGGTYGSYGTPLPSTSTGYVPPPAPSATSVRFNYDLNGMSGSWNGYQQIDTTYTGGSITLVDPPSHPDWQVFDGWTFDGWDNVSPGKTYTYGARANETHTVRARWHVRPDTVTIKYQDNTGSGCGMPGNQTVDSANYSSTTLSGPYSCPAYIRFDGWTINYTDYSTYGTFNFPQHTTGTYTATARTHINYTTTYVVYHLNGLPANQPATQSVNTTYSSGIVHTAGAPTGMPSWVAFDGWYFNAPGSGSNEADSDLSFVQQNDGTCHLYAEWHVITTNVTVTYNMGTTGCATPADQHLDSTTHTSGTLAGTPPGTCAAHTAFVGWTINGTDYAPGGTFTFPQHSTDTYTATARTRTVNTPTGLTATYHIAGDTVTLSGSANAQAGDKITACMTDTNDGTTPCLPAITAPSANSAWQWTATFTASDYATRYGYGHQHHFTAKLTSGTADSAIADLKGTLPWMTVTYDKGTATGTTPHNTNALVDTAAGKATIAVPAQSGMTAPTGAWFEGWKNPDGTLTWQAGTASIPTNTSGATTGPDGHTTLTLTAQWHVVPAPTGVTARYSHTDGYVYLTATGLQAGVTGWQIQVKPTPANYYYQSAYNTSTTGQSYYYSSYFTPGTTWTAQARATYTDPSGNSVTSDWSTESTGILPYMNVILKPGSQQAPGGDTTAKALIGTGDSNAYVNLPSGTGTKPTGMDFAKWATHADGTGDTYQANPGTAIPVASGTPGANGETRLTLYAQWIYIGRPPAPGHCSDSTGWSQWGTSATQPAIPGIDHQNTGAVCYTIVDEGTTLRLTGGTSPDWQSAADIPWNAQKRNITKISIEGDLTLTSSNYDPRQNPFNEMSALTALDSGGHRVTIDGNGGYWAFSDDTSLTSLDLTGWQINDSANRYVSLRNMFMYCTRLASLKGLDDWDTGYVTSTEGMFSNCSALTGLDLSGWKTARLSDVGDMFYGTGITDLDLSGWDTTHICYAYFYHIQDMLPSGLKRLRLGPHARLPEHDAGGSSSQIFAMVDATHTWHEWDWPKGHHPSDLGLLGLNSQTRGDGTLATLEARADSNPTGVYIRDDVTPTWTDLTYNLNGGTGDASLFTQPGAAATGSTPKRDGLAIDTTFKDGEYTIPDGTADTGNAAHHITGNKPQNLFQGWTIDTGNVTANASGGTATVSNHTITAAKGAGGTATITAQWTPAPQAMPGTPAVSVTPDTTDQGGVSVSVSATLDQAMPAIDAVNGDPAKPAVSAGGTVKICAKPASQNDDYYGVQCQAKASTTAGSQTITPDALELPGSARQHSNTASFPTFGQQYTMAATYTLTDPVTRNQIEAPATQSGGGSVSGTLAWLNASFDTNDAHGGNGTAPASLSSFVDTASGKAWIALPNATATMKPNHFVFAGWTATASATNPDTGMGDPANRNVQLPATTGAIETQTVLYAVWHKLTVPTVTSLKRDVFHNRVIITGTAAPWTRDDDIYVEINPLDGQAGFTLGSLNARISAADGQGHGLPYDGHTAHPWKAEIPEDQMPAGGRFRTRTMLEAYDHAWRDVNDATYIYSESELRANPPIAGHYQHALPLTGGQRTQLIVALVLVGVLLIAGSQFVRNRRRWHHQ
ncbi:BspA family leucine-rich repeat surface protein [Bifidobacterium sp. ESL0769]|uniref:BspA family leucine-rich repeat surface protein n=1 Tax=Bifidobacterium sp. ESL0769 TaxID=2983229 RepID=UPI0023F7F2A5|nr:BspA family leucine-rich repeat surface protein [Bifidobacterium sp. ESL0769]WEV67429.1 BspA family leucine-rich repeat surface protein [Bifidobacterium sp. ESL0769]